MTKIYNHKSGIKIIHDLQPKSPTVGINFCINVGSINETQEQRGISHFIEHVLFTGTDKRTKEQITYEVEQSGASMNAYTTIDKTVYTMKCMENNFHLCLSVMSDMIANCKFYDDQVETERSIILQEINDGDSSPDGFAYNKFYEMWYSDKEMSTSVIGTADIVSKLTSQDLKNYHAKYYTPERMILSVTGNIDEEAINSIIDEYFENKVTLYNNNNLKLTPSTNKDISIQTEFKQDIIIWGYDLGVISNAKDFYISTIVNMHLGQGFSSILFRKIRDEHGLVYGIGSVVTDIASNTGLLVYTSSEKERSEKIISLLPSVISELKNITEQDLEHLKNRYNFKLAGSSEVLSNSASKNLSQFKSFGKTLTFDETKDIVNNITIEDCHKFIDNFLKIEPVKFISKAK